MIEITLIENDTKTFEKAMQDEMAKAIKHFEGELIKIRTGRAHTTMVEDLMVTVYGGAPMALKGLASLAAPEPRLITIQPWDTSILGDIERAIRESDLGVAPINDGAIIRLQLPEMSGSRREELVKLLGKKLEESKIAIRNTRRDFYNLIRDAKQKKTISENFYSRLEDLLQKVTDVFTEKADALSKKKEQEIKTV